MPPSTDNRRHRLRRQRRHPGRLKTFTVLGVYGMSAITAITAQNTIGVTAIHVLPADLVTAQIEAVAGDMRIDAVKTGMLASSAIVEAVAAATTPSISRPSSSTR